MTQEKPIERQRRLYWLKNGDDDRLVFDPGYYGGDVHIYKHWKSVKASDIRTEVLKGLGIEELPEEMESNVVMIWAEKRGLQLAWEVSDSSS